MSEVCMRKVYTLFVYRHTIDSVSIHSVVRLNTTEVIDLN